MPKPANTKWHYQQVHHDLWDFDSPFSPILFKGEMNGEYARSAWASRRRPAGFYLVDQKTGKPIYPIPEVKVPQDPQQNTWPTQPEPTMEPFSPIEATPEAVEKAEEAVASSISPKPKIVENKVLHPAELAGPERDQPGVEPAGRRRQLAAVLLRPGKRTCTSSLARAARWA